jgi:enoyl-CoA hydratase
MENTVGAISPGELERLCQQTSSAGSYSSLTGHSLVLLDLADRDIAQTAERCKQLPQILPRIACPVIAIAPEGDYSTLTESVDVVVASHKEAQSLAANILQHPLTAMTLVQLLRHNEKANLDDGLLAESLAFATLQGSEEFRNYLDKRPQPPAVPVYAEPAVLVERENDTLSLTLNRPEQRNAYSIAVRDALYEALELQALDPSVERTIIRGAGACFCTGGALEEFGLADNIATAHAIRSTRHVGRLIAMRADEIECHLHRACIGSGIELPAFAGRVVAQKNTYFQLPEITMGLIPGAGGTVSILRRIGRQRLAYLALSAKRIKAETALAWGLIDEIA